MNKNTGRYVAEEKQGDKIVEIVRYDRNRKYTKEELKTQRDQFTKDAKAGKMICLSDLMINHGM